MGALLNRHTAAGRKTNQRQQNWGFDHDHRRDVKRDRIPSSSSELQRTVVQINSSQGLFLHGVVHGVAPRLAITLARK